MLVIFYPNTVKTTFCMENSNQRLTMLESFFPKISAFFSIFQKGGNAQFYTRLTLVFA